MIKIKSWFQDDDYDIRDYYLRFILSKLNMKEDDTIKFLPGKEIDLKTLLIGKREEVLDVSGIVEYIGVFRCKVKNDSNYSKAVYLDELHNAFYNDIKCEKKNKHIEYSYGTDTVILDDTSGKKIVKGDMDPFYKYYMKMIYKKNQKTPKNYTNFKKLVVRRINHLKDDIVKHKRIDYDLISDNMRHRLLSSLHIKCCPYCNRQYITTWTDETKGVKSTADLDHFYQKSTYPLFALSLFNFVPSCQICNSRMKNSNDTETLYPYEEGMDEFKFRCKPKDGGSDDLVDLWLANKTNDPKKLLEKYKLELFDNSDDNSDVTHIQRIKGSKEVFHLEEVYQTHLEAAINEMLKIRIYFSGDYSKYAKKTLDDIGLKNDNDSTTTGDSDVHSKSKFSEDEMRNIILGFVYDGQDKLDQPLGKMLSDILENELENKQLYD